MTPLPPSAVYGFTVKASGLLRVLKTPIQIAQAFNPQKDPRPPHKQYVGIWDTGATNSVITEKVINECGLKPISIVKVCHAAGENLRNVFLVNIILPSAVGISNVRVTEGILTGDSNVLIGMDVISRGDLALTNFNGKTCFTFRIPSKEVIDFRSEKPSDSTPDTPADTLPKVGRNAPCPCGSGKKYKKCHGR